MSVPLPRVVLSIEVEGEPHVRIEASDSDLDALVSWLSAEPVREELDRLVKLHTGRTPDEP